MMTGGTRHQDLGATMGDGPASPNDESSGLLQRLVERNFLSRLLLGIAALVGAIVTIAAAGHQVWTWYDNHFRWITRTEHELESLRANVTVEEFDTRLGRPRILTPAQSSPMTQRIYQGRGFWVQAVSDQSQSVVMFSVTACDRRLKPSWEIWNGRDRYVKIVVNVTTVANSLPLKPTYYEWFISGATANSHIYAHYSGGSTTNYLSYAWGQNDACQAEALSLSKEDYQILSQYDHEGAAPTANDLLPQRPAPPPEVQDALSRATINTFAIFGIRQKPEGFPFQIGADRILTRTLEGGP
jgi:hypothetical protein